MEKRLYRIREGRKLCGVCGGIAEYLEIDPTIIRLFWIFGTLFACVGVFAYLICALIIPEQPY